MIKIGNSHQDFKDFEQRKYANWKTKKGEQRTEDQKAFDDYVKSTVAFNHVCVRRNSALIYRDFLDYIGNNLKAKPNSLFYIDKGSEGRTASIDPADDKYLVAIKLEDLVTVVFKFDDYENTSGAKYGYITGRYNKKDSNGYGLQVTAWGTDASGGGEVNIGASANASSLPAGETATANVVKGEGNQFTFSFGIPKGEKGERGEQGPAGPAGPSGGGSGGGTKPDLPPMSNAEYKTVKGQYGLNLFDYREMSRDPRFSVNGKEFYLNGKRKITDEPEVQKNFTLYNRIRNNQTYKINATLIDSSDNPSSGNNDLHAKILYHDLFGVPKVDKDIFFTYNSPTTSQTVNHTQNYSYLSFEMGGVLKPQKGRIKLEAYYGDFCPNNLEQKFEFTHYNGVHLLANSKGVRDEYIHTKWYDYVKKRLNVVHIKDLKVIDVDYSERETNKLLYLQVPEDCWTVEEDQTQKYKEMKDCLMTSNLCDIEAGDDQGNPQSKPFFMKRIETQTVIDKVTKKPKDVKCFVILLPKVNASQWINHLGKTEIVYPIVDNTKEISIPLQKGGWVFILNSKQQIFTHNYKTIETKKRTITFKDSPFGYPDISVDADNVASVILHDDQSPIV